VGYTIFRAEELEFVPRAEGDPRSLASRANVWRYPPGAQGKWHRDLGQEEVFVVLEGS
jgi:mannose-6-phosphate isomerase-like protein (cupin superfamily)